MMNRQTPVPFSSAAAPRGAAPMYKAQQPGRVPVEFIKAMKLIQGKPSEPSVRTLVMTATTQLVQRRAAQPPVRKWKSSFKPVDGGDDAEDKDDSEGVDLYDPYNPVLSDPEFEMTHRSNSDQDNTLQDRGCRKKSRWDCSDQHVQHFKPETRPCENPGFSPAHRLTYIPDTEPLDPPRYDNIGRLLEHRVEHRVCSPDRTIHGASSQRFPASYGGQSNGEERRTVPEYRREASPVPTALRLSPPRLQRDYHHQQGHVEAGQDRLNLSSEVTRNSQKVIVTDKSPITCDLCEVELANGQELEDHLDSKSHWDTLEHIQQQNGYDDLAVAFLQEVMVYKSRQYSRAIEDSALQALQENDHMTKVEMFHCAACDVFVSTSASSVQAHITCQGHLSKTKAFEVQQRQSCLGKADTIIKELKPQFEHFMQGGTPFQ